MKAFSFMFEETNKTNKVMNTKDTIGGLIIGAVTGVALGLLFAPKKGSETREALASDVNNLYDRVSEDFKSSFEDQLDRILTKSSSRAEERARKQIEEVKKEIAQIKAN